MPEIQATIQHPQRWVHVSGGRPPYTYLSGLPTAILATSSPLIIGSYSREFLEIRRELQRVIHYRREPDMVPEAIRIK